MVQTINLDYNQIGLIISALGSLLWIFTALKKRFHFKEISNFDFSLQHFLIGLSACLILSLALFSLNIERQTYVPYFVDDEELPRSIQVPQTIQKIEKKLPSPPKPPKPKALKKIITTDLIEPMEAKPQLQPKVENMAEGELALDTVIQKIAPPMVKPKIEEKSMGFVKRAEQMPRFPGCETMEGTQGEKEKCSQKLMLEYIYENLSYPKLARENGIEGLAVIRFIVTEEGDITDIELMRDPGGGCGKAATKVVSDMRNLPEKWTPGRYGGRKVKVQYHLPVKFALQ